MKSFSFLHDTTSDGWAGMLPTWGRCSWVRGVYSAARMARLAGRHRVETAVLHGQRSPVEATIWRTAAVGQAFVSIESQAIHRRSRNGIPRNAST
jgi:hypothetical protein